MLASCLLIAVLAAATPWWTGSPVGLALSAFGAIGAAAVVAAAGATFSGQSSFEQDDAVFGAFCWALTAAGLLGLVFAFVQKFAPQYADGTWIAYPSSPGRVGGNLRQPNHLSSLLLWSSVALVWLYDAKLAGTRRATLAWQTTTACLMTALMLGVVLTVSRTGTVCVLLMAVWGGLDKRLSRFSRVLLCLLPLIYLLCWMGMAEWAQTEANPAAFAGSDQLQKSDLSSSRFAIWSNTLSLIKMHPWLGVGWGEFNFAWTLTPFPDRPTAFFDHTHNLPLQLAVEMGVPLATLVMGLLLYGLWRAWVNCRTAPLGHQPTVRAALVMVLMMGIHSLLEYPLWYAYFLLPTAFAFGTALSSGRSPDKAPVARDLVAGRRLTLALRIGGALMVLGGVFAVYDYSRVVSIFAPSADAAPLPERIAIGQRSLLFGHHADYAAATTAEPPSSVMSAFERAPHHLLDTRLMMAWARALDERGETQKARYLAQRLKEFRNPMSADFFAVCGTSAKTGDSPPFQCVPPTQAFTFEDFR